MRSSSSLLSLLVGLLFALGLGCGPSVRPLVAPDPQPRRAAPVRPDPVRPPPISLTSSDGTGLVLATVHARAVVEDPLALTELELAFDNPRATAAEGRFEILLPPGARVTRFALWQGGQWQEAEVVERQHARQAYEAELHRGRDPALLERDTGNRFRARVFPIGSHERKRVLVSYTEELADPEQPYRLLARDLPWLEELEVRVLLHDPLGGPSRPEYQRLVGQAPGRDVVVPRHAPASGGIRRDDRVVARVEPLAGADPGALQPIEHLTVLVDGSASRALDYDQAVEHLGQLLRALSRGASTAQLEVVVFDQGVETIYEGPLGGLGRQTLAALHARRPLGATDLRGALEALGDGERDRLLLVGDGLVSAGSDSDLELERALRALARHGLERVDVLALGHVRDDARLRRLATALSDGGVLLDEAVPPEASAQRMLRPTFDRVHIDVPGASWWYPRTLDGVQPGDFVIVHAELPPEHEHMRVQVNGPVTAEHEVEVRDGGSPLVEHAWMHGRVASLIERVETLHDALESERLRALAVALSVRHRVLNDLTAMLVLESEEDYARYGLDRRALADVLMVGPTGARLEDRGLEPEPEPEPSPDTEPSSEGDDAQPDPSPAGATIYGTVSERRSDDRVAHALVILQCNCLGGTRETNTNANGQYAFRDLPPGTYSIQVLAGHADVTKVTKLPAGARFRANFRVDPNVEFRRMIRVPTRAEARRSRRRERRADEGSDTTTLEGPPARPQATLAPGAPPPPPPEPPPPAEVHDEPAHEVQGTSFGVTISQDNLPAGRDFTQVVEASATVTTDSAGISLAGTTGAESMYSIGGHNVTSTGSGVSSRPSHAEVLIRTTLVDGDVSRRSIQRDLRNRHSVLESCYHEALQRDDELWGRMRVELRLDAQGRVIRAGKRWQIGLEDEELLRCVERVLEGSTLDTSGHRARVSTTLIFAPFDGPPRDYTPPPADTEPEPPTPSHRWAEIERALIGGHVERANALAWAWREEAPTDVLALLALGSVARERGDLELAARAYGSVLDLHPSQAPMRRLAAARLLALEHEPARALAIDALEEARRQRPDHPTGHRALAMALLRDDRPREAFEALARGLVQRYPPGRSAVALPVMAQELGILAAAWLAASPTDGPLVEERLRQLGIPRATTPSLRFVMTWETDASDVDLWVQDAEGNQVSPDHATLPTGGRFVADAVDGFGPEAFVIEGAAPASPYHLRVQYYDRGPMGYGMGEVQVLRHDGEGGVDLEVWPFELLDHGGLLDIGFVEATGARPSVAQHVP